MKSKFFTVNKLKFEYCDSSYKNALNNERAVEVSLAKFFVNCFGFGVTEVGATLPYYDYKCGEVIDIEDSYENSIRKNAIYDIDYTNKNIVSISTIHTFNSKDYNNKSDLDANIFVEKVVKRSKNYLLTFPLGYNKKLDEFVQERIGFLPCFVLKKNDNNEWVEEPKPLFNYEYKEDNVRFICVITNMVQLTEKYE
jgi:hypothetical protein